MNAICNVKIDVKKRLVGFEPLFPRLRQESSVGLLEIQKGRWFFLRVFKKLSILFLPGI